MIKIVKWICEWTEDEMKGTHIVIGNRLHIFKGLWNWKTLNIQGFKTTKFEKEFNINTPYYGLTIGKIKLELWKNKKDNPFRNVTVVSERVLI